MLTPEDIAIRIEHAREGAEAALVDHREPWPWWSVSFSDTDKPEGQRHLGTVLVDSPATGDELVDIAALTIRCRQLGCNPGGWVSAMGPFTAEDIAHVPDVLRHRLLTVAEVDSLNERGP